VSEELRITGFWSFLKAILFRPAWEFYTVGGFFTFLFVGTWWRDNFASDEWKRKLELKGIIPQWHPAWWLCIGLLIILLLAVRESYRLWLKAEQANEGLRKAIAASKSEPLPVTAPQVSLKSETAESLPIRRLLLSNISRTEPIYNIVFQPVRLKDGANVIWIGEEQQLLSPGSRMALGPILFLTDSYVKEFKGVESVVKFLQLDGLKPSYDIGPIAFTCEDGVQNRYLVTFRVEVTSGGNRMNVKDIERIRIGSRPSLSD
jgi:hypothetical protein